MTEPNHAMAQALCDWFVANSRPLPFRETKQAYCIWISEIMAQQTRMATLIPYYQRFVARFPTVFDLAAAHEDEVLLAWQGLGYYSRARNLHKAAKLIVSEFGGELPRDVVQLQKLPGIGAYTAGAIASIAFEQEAPAIDGNALRVFARLEALGEDVMDPRTVRKVTEHVRAVMQGHMPSVFTQAVMELGALICLPTAPLCEQCPVASHCQAFLRDEVALYPLRSTPKAQRQEQRLILIARNDQGEVLLRRREERLLHNLWEFPGFGDEQALRQALHSWGFGAPPLTYTHKAKHVFTHVIWQMQGVEATVEKRDVAPPLQWVSQQTLADYAMPTALKAYTRAFVEDR